MSGLFGSPTISTTDTRINSMRIQQSAYGLCQALIYGKTRATANMFWFGDFESHAHTETQKTGGKGGGSKTQHTSFTYSASLMLGLCENKINRIEKIWIDKEQLTDRVVSGVNQTPLEQLGFELFKGYDNLPWGYLEIAHPSEFLRYKYLGYVAASKYDMGGSPSLSNHSFELVSDIHFSDTIHDANPADVIEDLIKNPRYGAAPTITIGNMSEFRTYCAAANLFVSPAYVEQRDANEIIEELVEAVNCAVVPSADGFKIMPFGDAPLIANGYSYTPNLTSEYVLTDDDFISDDGVAIVTNRSRDTDAYNHVQVEFFNRYNQYNTETVPASDQANIEMYGLRSEDPVNYSFFCEPKMARHAAQLRLQKYLYVRNQFQFKLGWKYCLLEPMDIVTISSISSGIESIQVRIMSIDEDEDGLLSFTAEELSIGSRSAIEYDLQSSSGYQGGDNFPGMVNAPVIFEPPLDLTDGKNSVWLAVSGGQNWGGCNIWTSLDNATYERIGTVFGSARYGIATSAMSDNSTSVNIELNTINQLFSGTLEDAQSDLTMFKIGDEYMNYVDATLIGSNAYTLSGILRGRYDASISHAINEPFVRLDKAIFKYTYHKGLDGKQIYFKFTSFNGLQQKEQTLDEVSAYIYTLNGGKPASVEGLSLQSPFIGTSFKSQWMSSAGATLYHVQILSNASLKRAVTTTNTDYSYGIEEATIDGLGRAYTIRVASESNGQLSTFAELNIANPIPPKMLTIYTSATANSVTVSWNPVDVPDLKDYAVWISTNPSLNPSTVAPNWTGTDLTHTFAGLSGTTVYYIIVTARDVWKDATWNYSDVKSQSTS